MSVGGLGEGTLLVLMFGEVDARSMRGGGEEIPREVADGEPCWVGVK